MASLEESPGWGRTSPSWRSLAKFPELGKQFPELDKHLPELGNNFTRDGEYLPRVGEFWLSSPSRGSLAQHPKAVKFGLVPKVWRGGGKFPGVGKLGSVPRG